MSDEEEYAELIERLRATLMKAVDGGRLPDDLLPEQLVPEQADEGRFARLREIVSRRDADALRDRSRIDEPLMGLNRGEGDEDPSLNEARRRVSRRRREEDDADPADQSTA